MSLGFLFGAVYAVAAAVMLWSLTQLNRFLAETRDIGDEGTLQSFKVLARMQMYLALCGMVLLASGMLHQRAHPGPWRVPQGSRGEST